MYAPLDEPDDERAKRGDGGGDDMVDKRERKDVWTETDNGGKMRELKDDGVSLRLTFLSHGGRCRSWKGAIS